MGLVKADVSDAQNAAGLMAEGFTDERPTLKALANSITASENIEKQRQLFSEFTKQIEPFFKDNLSGGTIYKKHCPMAFDNQGADWFSDIPEINNPYFGDKMLRCGKVTETIKK